MLALMKAKSSHFPPDHSRQAPFECLACNRWTIHLAERVRSRPACTNCVVQRTILRKHLLATSFREEPEYLIDSLPEAVRSGKPKDAVKSTDRNLPQHLQPTCSRVSATRFRVCLRTRLWDSDRGVWLSLTRRERRPKSPRKKVHVFYCVGESA